MGVGNWRKKGPDSIEARSSELEFSLRNISLACFLYSASSDSLYVISPARISHERVSSNRGGWGGYLFVVDRCGQGQSLR
jgi:hypothetical protein